MYKKLLCILTLALGSALHAQEPAYLELKKGQNIAILGNTLADRQQHHGWFEALIHKANPDKELVIRNLGYATDEIMNRPRSEKVPAPDEWLTRVKADVVLAYFGFNESFKGPEGLDKFKQDLTTFIKATKAANYNGKGAPVLVLFSPIAHEDIKSPHFPNGEKNSANLALYAQAMAEVAKENQVQYVNLLEGSKQAYAASSHPLTHNGIHLTEEGDKLLAPVQFKGLFGVDAPKADEPAVEEIRKAVLERNQQWHHLYRTVDQYNIYGSRGFIKYEGITNNQIMLQELAQREVMTQNRDKQIWALAGGKKAEVKDDNLPPVDSVPTNKKDATPYLDGVEAIKHMKLAPGLKVELVASEKEFPELVNPVQMGFDTKGRLWVAAWPNYPGNTPTTKDYDKLLVFDLDPKTGKAVKVTRFLESLNCPTGFQFYKDGVLVMQSPDLWYVRDTNGDGKADWKERVLSGLDAADSHHETNSMCLEPGGAVYLSDGIFHRTSVETTTGPVRNEDGAIYRFEPLTNKFERYISYGFANPHGRAFDYWGNDIITDATGNQNFYGPGFSGFLSSGKHAGYNTFWKQPSRPSPGTNFLTSRHFPDDWQGEFLNANVISFQGIYRARVTEEGSGIKGETVPEHLISSSDPNFRPSAMSVAPDGSIYVLDWQNAIIGHLQHHLRDPNRDHKHGRIYRITYEGRPLLEPKKIAGEPIEALLEALKEPENDVRMRAKIELSTRNSELVLSAVEKWVTTLDKDEPKFEHNRLEALWVHQWHNMVNIPLLKQVLLSPDHRARAQAVRVLCYWRDRVPNALDLLSSAVNDKHPRVRLEAVRTLSFFNGNDLKRASQLAYEVLNHEMDYYLNYSFKATMKQLRSLTSESILPSNKESLAKYIGKLTDTELESHPDSEPILLARMARKSYDVVRRDKYIKALAKLRGTNPVTEMVSALEYVDTQGSISVPAADLAKMLVGVPQGRLSAQKEALSTLANEAKQPAVRRAAWAALTMESKDAASLWAQAATPASRRGLVDAIAILPDPALRAKFQPYLVSTLEDKKSDAQLVKSSLKMLPLMGVDHAATSFAILADALKAGQHRSEAANALMQLPRTSWNKEASAEIARSVLDYAKTVEAAQRSEQAFVELNQLGMEAASFAGLADVSKELRGLGVAVFVVKTVHEQLRFDTTRLVVEKGKPFEILFENNDMMPHNLVVVAPGKHLEIGNAAMTMTPDKKDKEGRQYLPNGHKFIAATHMLNAGEKEKLQIKAPDQEGEYEYVCTFPGHAMIMWGKLVVTSDVDAYLQQNPTHTLPGTPQPPAH